MIIVAYAELFILLFGFSFRGILGCTQLTTLTPDPPASTSSAGVTGRHGHTGPSEDLNLNSRLRLMLFEVRRSPSPKGVQSEVRLSLLSRLASLGSCAFGSH